MNASIIGRKASAGTCGWYNDSILLWPPTQASHLANKSCSEIPELKNSCHPGRVFLKCLPDGHWENTTNYSECLQNITNKDKGFVPTLVAFIYFSFSCLSFILLILSVIIFYAFK